MAQNPGTIVWSHFRYHYLLLFINGLFVLVTCVNLYIQFHDDQKDSSQLQFSVTLTLKEFMHCFGLELSSFNEGPIFGSQHGGQSPKKLVARVTCFQCFFSKPDVASYRPCPWISCDTGHTCKGGLGQHIEFRPHGTQAAVGQIACALSPEMQCKSDSR